mmetsp:Transcript_23627/g.42738  ORF Transcript_23627/g.42738 Transcript_23627/m.42738 type:complete len:89 (+) Transcript_23627:414-680(+)
MQACLLELEGIDEISWRCSSQSSVPWKWHYFGRALARCFNSVLLLQIMHFMQRMRHWKHREEVVQGFFTWDPLWQVGQKRFNESRANE